MSDDDSDRPWSKIIPLTVRSVDGSQEPASTLESRFFASESKPPSQPFDRPSLVLPGFSVLTEALIDEVNAYAVEWASMDSKVHNLENGTGGSGGRQTWLEIAKTSLDRASKEDRTTFLHYFEVMVSLVMAEDNPKLLRSYLADVISASALWIRKLDSDERNKPTSP